MQVFLKANLAFLSVPKTGSTAYEMALKRHADIIFTKQVKHMTVGKFHRKFLPFIRNTYRVEPESIAVIRDPLDHIRSWYKYRNPARLGRRDPLTTGEMSFDEFVLDVISDDPSPAARIGGQYRFLTAGGEMPVAHLFGYEQQRLRSFLEERLDVTLKLKDRNISPKIEAQCSPGTEARLRKARAAEFALYDRVCDAGGHLYSPYQNASG